MSGNKTLDIPDYPTYYRTITPLLSLKYSYITSNYPIDYSCVTGKITAWQWCQVMESVLTLDIPWRMLRPRLVTTASGREDTDQSNVLYRQTCGDTGEGPLEYTVSSSHSSSFSEL